MSDFALSFIPEEPGQTMTARERIDAARRGELAVSPEREAVAAAADAEAEKTMDPARLRWAQEFLFGDGDPTTQNLGEKVGTAINTAGESLTFGLIGDEAGAAVDAALGRGTYDDRLEHYRDQEQMFADENPLAYAGSVMAPALLPAGAVARGVMAAPTLAGKSALSALAGAGAGATYGFMEGEGSAENRLEGARDAGAVGGLVGLASPGIARLAGMLANKVGNNRAVRGVIDAAPSLDDLKARAQAAYARADDAQPIPRERFAGAADEIADATYAIGRDPDLTPRAQKVMDRVFETAEVDRGANIGFKELDRLRRLAGAPAGMTSDRAEMAVGARIIEGIDDFIDSASDEMGGAAKEARSLWRQLRSSELLDDAFEKAARQASGFENGIRIQFRNILNNPSKARGLSEDVKKAMEAVVNGTPGGNFLRRIGRMMGPGVGQQTNMLGSGLSAGAGATLGAMTGIPGGGFVGAMVPPVLGSLAQRGAERSTKGMADLARALAASGAQLPVPTGPKIHPDVLRALLAGSAPTGMGMTAGPQ